MIYILITAVALLALNLYVAATTRQLMFQNKFSALFSRAQLVASSFTGTELLTEDSAGQVMALLEDVESTRILVTNASGVCLYDSSVLNENGLVMLLPEIVSALSGNDVFHCRRTDDALESHVAIPILYRSNPIGAVYLMEYDTSQVALADMLTYNLIRISVVLELLVILFSILFSLTYSKRVNQILRSIAIVREGDYNYMIEMHGNDEIRDLSEEFNKLTRRLQEAERVRRQFVSDASHELKTPLASIKLLSDSILQNEMPMQTVREFVLDIGNEADRLTRMSHKLLALSKLDSAVEEQRVVVDAADVAWRVCRMLHPQAELRHITVHTDLQEHSYLRNQEDSLHQIIFNLVENAIKYNRDGGEVFVRVSVGDGKVCVEVADTGFGIPESERAHVFDRFYRVDKARSRAVGGSGLGLSIVHDLVTHNDGSISVDAREGGGSVFRALFPLVETEVPT